MDLLLCVLNVGSYAAVAFAVLLLPVFIFQSMRQRYRKRPNERGVGAGWGVRLFGGALVAAFLMFAATNLVWGWRLNTFFRSPTATVVSIDGRPVAEPAPVIQALRSTRFKMAHHSHPVARLRIVLRDGDAEQVLLLGRDSTNPREYWVDYTRPGFSLSDGLGRIETDAFDAYPGTPL